MAQVLRPYQSSALDLTRAALARGKRRVLLVAPTGSGKTTIASAIMHGAVAKGRRVLFLAHRRELIDQCVARLAEHDITAGVILAGRQPFPHRAVQVASVQTLARREVPAADLVIIDEAHHARAKSYQRAVSAAPVVLGLTATPWRTDGRGLGELFEDLVVAARPAQLVRDGFLCPATGFSYAAPELDGVHTVGGDYDEDEAAEAMSYLGGDIVQRWLDHRPGRTVLFACTVEHSLRLAGSFRAAGVAAEHLDGTTPKDERSAILARLADGSTEVVCNCAVLTEGWDLPQLRCVVLARPTKSVGLYLQMAGRGLRPADGKTVARIHDHTGNALRHGLVDQDRDYALDGDTKKSAESVPTKTCPKCFAIFAPAPKCPACGFEIPVAHKPFEIEEVAGQEVAFGDITARRSYVPEGKARPLFLALAAEGAEKGYKPGWAAVQFKARLGFWPRAAWRETAEAARTRAVNATMRLLGGVDAARSAWLGARAHEPDET